MAAGTSIIFTLGNNPNTVSAGASGAIFGVMGGLLYCIISDIIQKKRHRVEEIGLTGMIFHGCFSIIVWILFYRHR